MMSQNTRPAADAATHARMWNWYRSWFRTRGTLDLEAYSKHVLAAFGSLFGFGVFSLFLSALGFGVLVALHLQDRAVWLLILTQFPLGLLGAACWTGILVASTIRFVRGLLAAWAARRPQS